MIQEIILKAINGGISVLLDYESKCFKLKKIQFWSNK